MLMGALLLILVRQLMLSRSWINLFTLIGLVFCLFYAGLAPSVVLMSLCLYLWIYNQHMSSSQLLLYCLVVILMVLFLESWLVVVLVTCALMLLLYKSWHWVNRSIDYFSLIQLLCVLLMGGLLVFNFEGWLFGLTVLAFLVLTVCHNEVKTAALRDSGVQWLDMVEQSRILERQRIYSNIHDEVGASLLQLIYQLDGKEQQAQAKSVMQKIRTSVADTSQFTIKFSDLYHDITSEAELRLTSTGITFEHKAVIENDSYLDVNMPVNLSRMIRESISNIIRHSGATEVHLEAFWQDKYKGIVIKDNGRGFSSNQQLGKGINSIKKRAKTIDAQVSWQQIEPTGTALRIEMTTHD